MIFATILTCFVVNNGSSVIACLDLKVDGLLATKGECTERLSPEFHRQMEIAQEMVDDPKNDITDVSSWLFCADNEYIDAEAFVSTQTLLPVIMERRIQDLESIRP